MSRVSTDIAVYSGCRNGYMDTRGLTPVGRLSAEVAVYPGCRNGCMDTRGWTLVGRVSVEIAVVCLGCRNGWIIQGAVSLWAG